MGQIARPRTTTRTTRLQMAGFSDRGTARSRGSLLSFPMARCLFITFVKTRPIAMANCNRLKDPAIFVAIQRVSANRYPALTHARQTTAAATASASARMRAKESLRVAIARLLRSTMAQRAAKLQLHTWKCCPVEVCAQDLVLISTTVKICQVASAWTQQWWATASAKAAITSRRAKPIACKLPPVEPSALTQPDAVLYTSQRHARKARNWRLSLWICPHRGRMRRLGRSDYRWEIRQVHTWGHIRQPRAVRMLFRQRQQSLLQPQNHGLHTSGCG